MPKDLTQNPHSFKPRKKTLAFSSCKAAVLPVPALLVDAFAPPPLDTKSLLSPATPWEPPQRPAARDGRATLPPWRSEAFGLPFGAFCGVGLVGNVVFDFFLVGFKVQRPEKSWGSEIPMVFVGILAVFLFELVANCHVPVFASAVEESVMWPRVFRLPFHHPPKAIKNYVHRTKKTLCHKENHKQQLLLWILFQQLVSRFLQATTEPQIKRFRSFIFQSTISGCLRLCSPTWHLN